ncbi:TrbC/VirB2 family protein [Lysobacter sp. HDW10]|uniref:TrbC/VirB2 family protein n=1 Tax=Lysobacter sp. HDW10 TaxID=2714936 RepID=UPI00140C106A|nr:TrbC/VirB2 family protein [Lysobacter sp. HDW10]QIK81452.1 TrbC/VirB2 family protein [Lysobacter sp. HDW10]
MHTSKKSQRNLLLLMLICFAVLCVAAPEVLAAEGEAEKKLCGVMGQFYTLLKAASVLIVTVAVIFAGYQIAFAHKRISEVAPVLIGGILIGAAAQIATMMISNKSMVGKDGCSVDTSAYVVTVDALYRA